MNKENIPWPIKAYLIALLIFATLLVFASFDQYRLGVDRDRAEQLFQIAGDGLKIVLGALMGALSMLVGKHLKDGK